MADSKRGVVDLGCGLGNEVAHLAEHGMQAIGIDISHTALQLGRAANHAVQFARGDIRRLPLSAGSVSILLDRGCFHYLQPEDRPSYVDEAARVLLPGGRLLLRACLPHEWMEQNLNEGVLKKLFAGWHVDLMRREPIPVDTGELGGIVARLRRPAS